MIRVTIDENEDKSCMCLFTGGQNLPLKLRLSMRINKAQGTALGVFG